MNSKLSIQPKKTKLDATGKTVFDDIYTAPDPRPYCETMQSLAYAIPEHAQPMFNELLAAYRAHSGKQAVRVLDLGSSYGINAALLRLNLCLPELFQRYTSAEAQALSTRELVHRDRLDYANHHDSQSVDIVGFDISGPALDYAMSVGLIVDSVQANLEQEDVTDTQSAQLRQIDCIISSGCIGYVTSNTLDKIIHACEPQMPWMGHCVLRMFCLNEFTDHLTAQGYEVDVLPEPVRQRRFASKQEQVRVMSRLIELGVDPTGYEDQGWLYAWLVTAKPTSALKKKTGRA